MTDLWTLYSNEHDDDTIRAACAAHLSTPERTYTAEDIEIVRLGGHIGAGVLARAKGEDNGHAGATGQD